MKNLGNSFLCKTLNVKEGRPFSFRDTLYLIDQKRGLCVEGKHKKWIEVCEMQEVAALVNGADAIQQKAQFSEAEKQTVRNLMLIFGKDWIADKQIWRNPKTKSVEVLCGDQTLWEIKKDSFPSVLVGEVFALPLILA